MISFAYPWLLILLPVPFLLTKFLPAWREGQSSLRIPRLNRLAELTGHQPASGAVVMRRSRMAWTLLVAAWASALLSVTRPQWIGEPIINTLPYRDMLLAVDLSGSMSAEDFTDSDGNLVDRLTACKQVLDEFLNRREGDRVGLIFFGSAAFVQAPFTEDLDLLRTLMDEAQVGMAGPQTVIGDAVGLAMTVFERSEQEDRVLILLTDGNDTGSKVTPAEAAKIGRDKGVTIYTIAVGDPAAVGEEKIDEETLQQMAKVTGGNFYRASDRQQLEGIYETLDGLETRELQTESYRPKSELFFWPLGVFLLIGISWHGFHAIRHYFNSTAVRRHLGAATILVAVCLSAGSNLAASDLRSPTSLSAFHFIRPLWLLALIPVILVLIAILRKQDVAKGLQSFVDQHLLKHLVVRPQTQSRVRPVYFLAIAWILAVLGLAGPTWQRELSPFASDQAALIFVQKVTPTMLAQDIQPSRLQRSVHKIRDLLALRPGTESALIAYSGSAHLVMPITGDANIIETFASELDPKIMPKPGDAVAQAIQLANEQLNSAGRPGSIVLLVDRIDAQQNQQLTQVGDSRVHILAVAGDQSKPLPIDSPPATAIDTTALQASADAAVATLTIVSADNSDVQSLSRKIDTSFVAAGQEDGGSRWRDLGYRLTPLIVLMVLLWFRPGWMVKWD